jgi:ATP-dependent RNA helicase DeaD
MARYRIEVGYSHGVKPGNIVGAIANEAEIDSEYIGRIEIYDDHSTVDMPEGMPKEIFNHLKGVWVAGRRLEISLADSRRSREREHRPHSGGAREPGTRSAETSGDGAGGERRRGKPEGKARGERPTRSPKPGGKPRSKKRPAVAARKKRDK